MEAQRQAIPPSGPRDDRRVPVDWRRYATEARRARRKLPAYEHPLLVSLAVSVVFTIAGLWLLQLVGIGVGAGLSDLGGSIAGTLPKSQEGSIVIGEAPVSVSAAPLLDGLPEFTKANEVTFSGLVPQFAVKPDRSIELTLNAKLIGTFAIAPDGKFGGGPIALPDGSSTIVATLVEGTTVIASTSQTVVVDHTPPALAITRPKPAEEVTGPDVIIEGRTEATADVTVNDRALRPNPDGAFTERIVAQPGPLKIVVVAKDKAGNETRTELAITVKAGSTAVTAGTALAIVLDRTKVRPGETVVAHILATQDGRPKAGLAITLQVGVITIGTYTSDANGLAIVGFAAPNHEVEDVAVVALSGGAAARVTLTVANPATPSPAPRP